MYSEPGSYVVRLTVTDTHGAASTRTQVYVVAASVANLAPQVFIGFIGEDALRGPAPLRVEFDGTNSYDPDGDDAGLDFEWIVNGIVRGTDRTVALTFTVPGIFSVQLKVTDELGAEGFAERPVIVEVGEPLGPFDIEPGQDVIGPTDASDGSGSSSGGSSSGTFCGLGMIMGLVGSLLGLFVMMTARRRTAL